MKVVNHSDMMKEYVKAVTKNINKNIVPDKIDLIISGGAFNGSYGYGIATVIKTLENENKLKVQRISGTSVGALLGASYFSNMLNESENVFSKLRKDIRECGKLNSLYEIIKTAVNKRFETDKDIEILNDRLFINYTCMKTFGEVVVSKYNSKDHLVEVLFKSCYIPLLVDGNFSHDDCVDGIVPYLFKDSDYPILHINLLHLPIIAKAFLTRNEKNPHYRTLLGVSDVSSFLIEGKSDMCSWLKDWSYKQFIIEKIKYLFCLSILIFSYYLSKIEIPDQIKNSKLCYIISSNSNSMYKDLLYACSGKE
jgi:hypothetical protein